MKNKISKKSLMYWTNLISLVPVIVLTFSGLLMQLVYHMGRHHESHLYCGLDKTDWSLLHKISASVGLIFIVFHLYLHWNWIVKVLLKRSLSREKKTKRNSLWLSIIFVVTSITSLLSWLVIENEHQSKHVIEIHDKLGVALVVLVIIHFIQHYKWFIRLLKNNDYKKSA